MQTPQAFPRPALRGALAGDDRHATDCASRVEARGGRVRVVEGDPRLLKITTRGRPRARRVMAVSAVFFDVGETLVDETRAWERHADSSACRASR